MQNVLEELNNLFASYEEVDLNDLQKHTDINALMLAGDKLRIKNRESIIREYNRDKWGGLLSKFKNDTYSSIYEFRKAFAELNEMNVCSWNSKYYLVPENSFNDIQGQVMARIIQEYFIDENIVELGCGFGSMLFDIASQPAFCDTKFIGGELTNNGILLTQKLAEMFNSNVSVGKYDFTFKEPNEIRIPENSIIYTSFALSCLPKIEESTLLRILALNPKYIVLFEPIFTKVPLTMGDILTNKYITSNDYNTDLSEVIQKMSKDKNIDVVFSSKHLIGENPLFSASLIVCEPR